jgi:putative tryptophan/tyrosine transport system substrate-binding protein
MKKLLSAAIISFIFFLASAVLAHAQTQPKIWRIGILRGGAPPDSFLDVFVQGLRDFGYIDGKNARLEVRFAEGKVERIPDLATELVQLKVDAVYAQSTPVILAFKQATKTIPIVFNSTSDPIGMGFVASLARPGGNITGVTLMASDLWPKRLEILKEIAPKVSRVAMLWNKSNAGMALEAKKTEEVAGPLGLALQDHGIKDADDLEGVFGVITKDRPEGFLALLDPVLNANRRRILDFLIRNRLPAIFENKEWVEDGGLMSYGPDFSDAVRRAAALTDKVLKGTKPADIPVEQPTKFEFVINLKTAKQIGLTIPPNMLARADRVIR